MLAQLQQIRAFLEQRWTEDDPKLVQVFGPSEAQCDAASVFLINVLGQGQLQGGYNWENGKKREKGGFLYGTTWNLHYWVKLPDGTILDLTADQFGAPTILVTKPGDKLYDSYVNTDSPAKLQTVYQSNMAKIKPWLQKWYAQQESVVTRLVQALT